MEDLYNSRMLLNALFFNNLMGCDCHKSLKWQAKKGDKTWSAESGWFIVMAELAEGQISFQYRIEYWSLFDIPIKEHCNLFDGHDAALVNTRLFEFASTKNTKKPSIMLIVRVFCLEIVNFFKK